MIDHRTVEAHILSLPGAVLEYPFGEGVAVYTVKDRGRRAEGRVEKGKMFALVAEGKEPVNLSLKCDPVLAENLREKYETVLPGYHLNKKHWNTLILTGQLPWEEVQALIRHSYDLVVGA